MINMNLKKEAGYKAAEYVTDGDILGLGTGSTTHYFIEAVGKRIADEGINVMGIPTSFQSLLLAKQWNIPVTSLEEHDIDLAVDGADEVDPHNNLIKGRGGAMFKEKLLIKSSGKTYIIVDESKLVSKLGSKYPIPVEVFPHALSHVENEIRLLGASKISLRLAEGKDGPVFTESGNFILDIHLSNIVPDLEQKLKAITGVIESGLFIGYDITVLMANR